ncbi:MAG: tetratricopeptide repeat protein [bacterium]|nr:MAG: tetratricopeptide repeat protein [bacterium]
MTKKKILSTRSVILLAFIIFTAASAFITWQLFPIPFGTLFDTFGFMTLLGLFGCLATLAIMGLRSRGIIWKILSALPAVFALAVGLLTAALLIDYKMIPGMAYPEELTSEQWIEDLHFLADQMTEVHPRLFEMIPQERFEAQVAELERQIPHLDENRIKWEIYRIVTLPNDAHTYFNIFVNKLDWHMMPLKLWLFPEGLYVLDAGREERKLIGTRVVAIENTPVEDAYRMLRPYLSAESEFHWKERCCYLLTGSEALRAVGICKGSGPIDVTFELSDGRRFTRPVKPVHYLPTIYWAGMRQVDNDAPYIFWNDRKDAYWFEYRESTSTLYVQFNQCVRESRLETIDQFVERLGAWVRANEFERCVIDIRKNDGGDGDVSLRLANLAIGSEKLDRPGRLFVLTSRKTFSAAVMFLSLLECKTSAVIVGEPTGQGPFFSAHPRPVTLPNSRIEINVSRHYNRCALINDSRNSIEPDVAVAYTYEDYLAGRDPFMEAVLSYEPPAAETAMMEPGEKDRLVGRYLFSPYQILTIDWAEEGLLSVDDFFEGSFRNVRTRLRPVGGGRFLTDIAGIEVVFDQNSGSSTGVTLNWRGIETYAGRAPDGHRLPMELFANGLIAEAVEAFHPQKDFYIKEVPGFEAYINRMGYTLLRDKKYDEAIAVLAMNVDFFPESFNTYDSLGEAYMESGRTQEAIQNYEKALELNPASENAKRMLTRLKKKL